MPKNRNRQKPAYGIGEVEVGRDFPCDDMLATDIVRLMAAYNDLSYVTEWMDAHSNPPQERASGLMWQGRFYLQLRLLAAFLHETLDVFKKMKERPAFKILAKRFDQDAISAMTHLEKVADGSYGAITALLKRTRNRTTFHYDRDVFKRGLRALAAKTNGSFVPVIVVRGRKIGKEDMDDVRVYYSLADEIRSDFSFGPRPQGSSWPEYEGIATVLGKLRIFLASALAAYREERGLAKLPIVDASRRT